MRRPRWRSDTAAPPVRLRCQHKDGGCRILEFTASRLDVESAPACIVLNARDVTAITETTAALRASEHRLDLALELGEMGVTEFDYATGELILSSSLTRLMGYDAPPPAPGLRWFLQHVHAEDRAALAAVFNAIKTPLRDEFEALFRLIRRDGVRWWSGRVRVIRGDDGQPTHAIGLVSNITERRHLEEQMRQAQKLEAVGRLAVGIAHDFHNRLTVITGYADTLLATVAPADPRFGDLAEFRRAADRATVLTPTAARVQPQAGPASGSHRRQRRGQGHGHDDQAAGLIGGAINLSVDLDTGGLSVLADRGQHRTMLVNLAVNAARRHAGRWSHWISTRLVTIGEAEAVRLYPMKPGPHVRLSVTDTGVGMPPEIQARVFEPFFTTKEPGKGNEGIGLSTVYGIVKQSGGFIFLRSEPGAGTSFDVYLPVAGSAGATTGARPADDKRRGQVTVLLVEDLRRVRELARRVLVHEGYRVLTAASAREALDIARGCTGGIDLLLTDVVIPGMSGPELARTLTDTQPETAILYMSGFPGDVLSREGFDPDTASLLNKPFTPAALSHKVRELLSARSVYRR